MKRTLLLLLVLMLVLSSFSFASPAPTQVIKIQGVSDSFNGEVDEQIRIVVELEGEPIISQENSEQIFSNATLFDVESRALVNKQNIVKNQIDDIDEDAEFLETYTNVLNGFSAIVDEDVIEAIKGTNGVKSVHIVNEYERPTPSMATSGKLIGADQLIQFSDDVYNGSGTVVAIIDTGIDPTHKDLTLVNESTMKLTKDSVEQIIQQNELKGKFFTNKVPYGYNFFDRSLNIIDNGPEASMHGMHVAGTVGSNGQVKGIAPNSQLLAMKVFSDNPSFPSTYGDIIIEAIDESIALGADVINMSLGSAAGSVKDTDLEQLAVQRATDAGIICSIAAGNEAFFGNGDVLNSYGESTVLTENPDLGVVGDPSIVPSSLSVASLENSHMMVKLLLHKVDGNQIKVPYMLSSDLTPEEGWKGQELSFVFCGLGREEDYDSVVVDGKVALIERGENTFEDKMNNAIARGAKGVIVYNKASEGNKLMRMYGTKDASVPVVFIGREFGLAMKAELGVISAVDGVEQLINPQDGKMSAFSSWGLPTSLDLKPEITAPGGQIYSLANNDQYMTMSGTSMAAPHVAGALAVLVQKIEADYPEIVGSDKVELAKVMLMNTAIPNVSKGFLNQQTGISESFKSYNSPRQQGAGLMDIAKAIENKVILTSKTTSLGKVTLGEIKTNQKIITFEVQLDNKGDEDLTFEIQSQVNTDGYYSGERFVDSAALTRDGKRITLNHENEEVNLKAGESKVLSLSFDLTDAKILNQVALTDAFKNGSFVEGFVRFISKDDKNPSLTIPFTSFYGEWDMLPIIDKTIYEDDINISEGHYSKGFFVAQDGMTKLGETYDKKFRLDQIVIGKVFDQFGTVLSSTGVMAKLSFLRNAKEVQVDVLNESGDVVRKIAVVNDVRKNYSGAKDSVLTQKLDWFWDGNIDGKRAENGQYYLRFKAKIDYPGARWQEYKYPVYVDNGTPQVEKVTFTYDGNGDIETAQVYANTDEKVVYGEVDWDTYSAPIIDKIPLQGGRGIRTYGLMNGDTWDVDIISPNGIFDFKKIKKNLVDGNNTNYRLIPHLVSYSGSIAVDHALAFEAKGKLDPLGLGDFQTVKSDKSAYTLQLGSYKSKKSLSFDEIFMNTETDVAIETKIDATDKMYAVKESFEYLTFNDTNKMKVYGTTPGSVTVKFVYPLSNKMKNRFVETTGPAVTFTTGASVSVTTGPAAGLPLTNYSSMVDGKLIQPEFLQGLTEGNDYLLIKVFFRVVETVENVEPKEALLGDETVPKIKVGNPEFWDILNFEDVEKDSKGEYINITGTVSDESSMESFRIDGHDVNLEYSTRKGLWTFEAKYYVKQGKNRVSVYGKDTAGNETEFMHEIIVDTILPSLDIQEDKIELYQDFKGVYAVINGTIADNMPVLRVEDNSGLIFNKVEPFWKHEEVVKPSVYELRNHKIYLNAENNAIIKVRDLSGQEVTWTMSSNNKSIIDIRSMNTEVIDQPIMPNNPIKINEGAIKPSLDSDSQKLNVELTSFEGEVALTTEQVAVMRQKHIPLVVKGDDYEVTIPVDTLGKNKAVIVDISKEVLVDSPTDAISVEVFEANHQTIIDDLEGVKVNYHIKDHNTGNLALWKYSDNQWKLIPRAFVVKDENAIVPILEAGKYALKPNKVTFNDVETHWAKNEVSALAAQGILEGDGDGSFRPDDKVTTAEFLKVVLEVQAVCCDSEGDKWYDKYVAKAEDMKLIDSVKDLVIDRPITRGQVIELLSKVISSKESLYTGAKPLFNDAVSFTNSQRLALDKLVPFGIISGDENGNANMNQTLSRSELVTMMLRLLKNSK